MYLAACYYYHCIQASRSSSKVLSLFILIFSPASAWQVVGWRAIGWDIFCSYSEKEGNARYSCYPCSMHTLMVSAPYLVSFNQKHLLYAFHLRYTSRIMDTQKLVPVCSRGRNLNKLMCCEALLVNCTASY